MVKQKHRYFLLEIKWKNKDHPPAHSSDIMDTLRSTVALAYGDLGMACLLSSLSVKYYNQITNLCIIRAAFEHYRLAGGAIFLVTSIFKDTRKEDISLKVLHVAGSIKLCQRYAIVYDKKILELKEDDDEEDNNNSNAMEVAS